MKILLTLLSFININCNIHPPNPDNTVRTDTNTPMKKDTAESDSLVVKNNTEFIIEIRASLGTGKQWMLEDSLNKEYLTFIRKNFVTDSTEMAAKPDLQIFVFKAIKQGVTTLSFVLKKPWKKKPDANAERKKYFINITG